LDQGLPLPSLRCIDASRKARSLQEFSSARCTAALQLHPRVRRLQHKTAAWPSMSGQTESRTVRSHDDSASIRLDGSHGYLGNLSDDPGSAVQGLLALIRHSISSRFHERPRMARRGWRSISVAPGWQLLILRAAKRCGVDWSLLTRTEPRPGSLTGNISPVAAWLIVDSWGRTGFFAPRAEEIRKNIRRHVSEAVQAGRLMLPS
jgi:hypothetical protein